MSIVKKKNIIFGTLILGFVTGLIFYKTYNKPHLDVSEESARITITASQILNDFSEDENSANTKYLDQIILVEGVISSIKIENKKGIIALQTTDDFGSVLCHLSEKATAKLKEFNEGDHIKIKGICTGFLMDVILIKSEIL